MVKMGYLKWPHTIALTLTSFLLGSRPSMNSMADWSAAQTNDLLGSCPLNEFPWLTGQLPDKIYPVGQPPFYEFHGWLDQSCLFDGHMIYDSHVLLLFLVSPTCLLPWSNQSQALTPRGQVLCLVWALCSLSCFSFIFNLPFKREQFTHTSFPQNSDLSTYASHCTMLISHYLTSHRTALQSHHLYLYTTPGDDPLPPRSHPLRAL